MKWLIGAERQKMPEVAAEQLDLSVLAPPIQTGEAVSSWLVRIADAHLLTLDELQNEIGCSAAAFDRGDLAGLERLAAVTRVGSSTLVSRIPEDLIAHPMQPGPKPPHGWAVCPTCLTMDVGAGRSPYVRQAWAHPLAIVCDEHAEPLIPHGNSKIKVASPLTLFGEGLEDNEARDILLAAARFDSPRMLARVRNVLAPQGDKLERLRLRWAVRDVVDALATGVSTPRAGSLMNLFEAPIFGRRATPGSPQLQQNWWGDVDAATRLLYVRVAMFILAEPEDPASRGRLWPLGDDWLISRYRHSKVQGWQKAFSHAALDPLILLRVELPRSAIVQLDGRSLEWPEDLRRRWTYAAALGAFSGFVF